MDAVILLAVREWNIRGLSPMNPVSLPEGSPGTDLQIAGSVARGHSQSPHLAYGNLPDSDVR